MSINPYPKYKDSGVEWLGLVPEWWDVTKFRFLFRESSEKIEQEIIGPMLSVSGYRGIEVKEYDDENKRRLEEDLIGYRIVRVGQLVVNTMWLNYAGLGVSDFEGHVSPAYRSYSISPDLNRRFCHHLLRSEIYVKGYTRLLTGVRPNSLQMSRKDLMSFPVIVPKLEEQSAIASFLDHETSKIDALIAEQEKLIELLKEKRSAVISHAVTKGLNPDVKMKDSGVEWLGMVPEGWEVQRLGYFFQQRREKVSDKDYPALSVTKNGVVPQLETAAKTDDGDNRKLVRSGDFVINSRSDRKGSSGASSLNGSVSLINTVIRPVVGIELEFVHHLLRSVPFQEEFYRNGKGIVADLWSTNYSEMRDIFLAIPSLPEQSAIASFLDHETAKIDSLTTEAQHGIDLLQERRSALISAAVTGQIDVRDFNPSKAA